MTLKNLKNEYAIKQGFANWNELLKFCNDRYLNHYINEVMKIYAMACLKLASENAEVIDKQSPSGAWYFGVCEESITNENNIIK